jgi:hypothetical protein
VPAEWGKDAGNARLNNPPAVPEASPGQTAAHARPRSAPVHGASTISALRSRLQQMAGVLGVPLMSFFDVAGEDGPVPGEILSGLKQHGSADLLRVYTSIRSPELRRSLLQIARELAGTEERALGPAIASAARRKSKEARLA